MNKWIILVLLSGIIAAGCVQAPQTPGNTTTKTLEKDWMIDGYATAHGVSAEQAKAFFQETYKISRAEDITAQLPKRTNAFEEDVKKIKRGDATGLSTIARENYVQPEFYDTFETTGKKMWINAPQALPNAVGLLSTPADQEATLEKNSETFEAYLFVGSAWGVTYYQGVGLTATITPEALVAFEIDPPTMLAGPTFPVLDEKWMERVHVTGHITGKMAPGRYVITVKAVQAPDEKREEWWNTHERYVDVDTTFVDPRGLATLTLNVPE